MASLRAATAGPLVHAPASAVIHDQLRALTFGRVKAGEPAAEPLSSGCAASVGSSPVTAPA